MPSRPRQSRRPRKPEASTRHTTPTSHQRGTRRTPGANDHDHANSDPGTAGKIGPWGVRRYRGERHDANWNQNETKPHHNVPTTAPKAKPQVL